MHFTDVYISDTYYGCMKQCFKHNVAIMLQNLSTCWFGCMYILAEHTHQYSKVSMTLGLDAQYMLLESSKTSKVTSLHSLSS